MVALDGAAVHGGAGVHSLHHCKRAAGAAVPPGPVPSLGGLQPGSKRRAGAAVGQGRLCDTRQASKGTTCVYELRPEPTTSRPLPEKWWWKLIFARRFWKDMLMPSTLIELMLRSPDSSNLAKASLWEGHRTGQ